MLESAAEEGITDLVASPHADPHFRYEPERVKDLAAELSARSPAAVKLHTACDFHLAHDNVVDALAHPRRYTIAGGPYLLVELSDLVIFPNTGELYARLEDAGMIVILTHPERNPLLRQRPELIRQWVAEGRLMQLTAQSIAGRWGEKAQRFSEWMLDQGLAHFVASDAHDDERRPPRLLEARERVAARAGEPVAGLLFETHPRAAVEGAPIDLRGFPPARPPGPFWRRFFRA
jgi:protein-tyrosine phosphatase